MKETLIDRVISYVSPRWAAERFAYKQAMLSYRGAITTRMGTPYSGSTSINGIRQPTLQDHRAMRDRARNLERNNPLAAGVLDRAVENIIGTGIRIEPRTDSPEFDAAIKPLWENFCRTCDVRKQRTFAEMQAQLVRSEMRDGDVGCVLVEVNGEPKLQPIEGDYIESPIGRYTGGMMVDGIELDGAGAPVRFYIKTLDEKQATKYQPISARDFIFLADPNQFSMVRGVTKFQQSFWLFDHIDGYLEGTVTAAKAASYFALLIKRNQAAKAFGSLSSTTNGQGNAQATIRLEPGTVQYLQPDEDVVQLSPQQPTQNFPDAIAAFARFVGLPFGLTIEQLMLDFSRTNYSSARAARLQAQQTAEMYQCRFADRFVSRVYQWWLSKMVKRGILVNAPKDFWKHEWIPQGKPWVDPSKEIDAAIKAVQLGVEARSYIALERGYDFGKLCEQNEADVQMLESHGLPTNPEGESGQSTNNEVSEPTEETQDENESTDTN